MISLVSRFNAWSLRTSRTVAVVWNALWTSLATINDGITDLLAAVLTAIFKRVPLLGGSITIVLLWVAVSRLWTWLVDFVNPITAQDRNTLVATTAQAVGALVLGIGAIFTFRSFRLNRESQVTERFTKATDQLGHEEVAVRLGGIYALERIALDSARDHGPIMEILAAYVRRHGRQDPDRRDVLDSWVREGGTLRRLPEKADPERDRADEDIQAVISILGRRHRTSDRIEPSQFDLSNTDLRFTGTRGGYLANVSLFRADLEHANLTAAILDNSVLRQANMRSADLYLASLRNANLNEVIAVDTKFEVADLQGASFAYAKCQRAIYYNSTLIDASFVESDLENALFAGANLTGASFSGAHLSGASFEGAVLDSCDLRGVDLRRVLGLSSQQIEVALTDHHTQLPPGINRVPVGPLP